MLFSCTRNERNWREKNDLPDSSSDTVAQGDFLLQYSFFLFLYACLRFCLCSSFQLVVVDSLWMMYSQSRCVWWRMCFLIVFVYWDEEWRRCGFVIRYVVADDEEWRMVPEFFRCVAFPWKMISCSCILMRFTVPSLAVINLQNPLVCCYQLLSLNLCEFHIITSPSFM